jgi:hypothetical protein
MLLVIGTTLRDPELNLLLRNALEDNQKLQIVALGPEVTVVDVADRIGCSIGRVGVLRGCFEAEPEDLVIKQGAGKLHGALRRYRMTQLGSGVSGQGWGIDQDFTAGPPFHQ